MHNIRFSTWHSAFFSNFSFYLKDYTYPAVKTGWTTLTKKENQKEICPAIRATQDWLQGNRKSQVKVLLSGLPVIFTICDFPGILFITHGTKDYSMTLLTVKVICSRTWSVSSCSFNCIIRVNSTGNKCTLYIFGAVLRHQRNLWHSGLLYSETCIKKTPSIKRTVAEVPKSISLTYFNKTFIKRTPLLRGRRHLKSTWNGHFYCCQPVLNGHL